MFSGRIRRLLISSQNNNKKQNHVFTINYCVINYRRLAARLKYAWEVWWLEMSSVLKQESLKLFCNMRGISSTSFLHRLEGELKMMKFLVQSNLSESTIYVVKTSFLLRIFLDKKKAYAKNFIHFNSITSHLSPKNLHQIKLPA